MIDLTAKILGAESVTMRLASAPAAVLVRVRTEVERLGIELQRKVKESKLTGQVLKVKTGRLRRSINLKVTEAGGSITGSVGTVCLRPPLEVGGSWTENEGPRPAKVARSRPRPHGQEGQHQGEQQGPRSGAIPVKAFSRAITVKPRPFLMPVLEEMRNPIRVRLAQAVAAGFKGGK